MKDSLGDRMKNNYESRAQQHLLRRAYSIIRIDGKAFHTYTRGLDKPFDHRLMEDMDETAKELCGNVTGARFAFVQSDEISLLLTDFENLDTEAWFNGNIQKMVSISASIATAAFNNIRHGREEHRRLAHFDSRVFQVPTKSEAENYFIWRQQDTVRNSISSVAQSLYSHKQLHGVNTSEMQELIFQKGTNWNDFPPYCKRGRIIIKEMYEHGATQRSKWVMQEVPTFTQERDFLSKLIPDNL